MTTLTAKSMQTILCALIYRNCELASHCYKGWGTELTKEIIAENKQAFINLYLTAFNHKSEQQAIAYYKEQMQNIIQYYIY